MQKLWTSYHDFGNVTGCKVVDGVLERLSDQAVDPLRDQLVEVNAASQEVDVSVLKQRLEPEVVHQVCLHFAAVTFQWKRQQLHVAGKLLPHERLSQVRQAGEPFVVSKYLLAKYLHLEENGHKIYQGGTLGLVLII